MKKSIVVVIIISIALTLLLVNMRALYGNEGNTVAFVESKVTSRIVDGGVVVEKSEHSKVRITKMETPEPNGPTQFVKK